jgi:hypothetical protein
MRLPALLPAMIRALLLGAIFVQFAAPAHAQWKWRDASGQVHYSDQPPPKSVPASKIQQFETAGIVVQSAAPATGADVAADADGKPKTAADRELALRRRQAQREADREAQRKQEEQKARELAMLGKMCDALRNEERTLESGLRIARVNAQGEPVVIDDEERAARLQAVQRDLNAHCPTS